MNRKKSRIAAIAVMMACFMALLGLAGCGAAGAAPEDQNAAQAEETAAEETAVSAAPDAEPAEEPAAEEERISEEKAISIALKDAGLSDSDVEYIDVDLDFDDGRTEYEVEFHRGTMEYDYSIEAYTGEILEKDIEPDND
ncbi:MAG: PepSY domain-containing protein [Firmicutes bacterium]|nr:PepSY domain-containing protein [Bacillota bacterium]